ncbi:hypothetical protein [Herbidospora sp. RD11066]
MSGHDPAGEAARAEETVAAWMTDPPLSGLATWTALLAEMWLEAGRPDEAAEVLDRADHYFEAYGERYQEGLRARLLQARGATETDVRAALERVRTRSLEREAHLFVQRADRWLGRLRR